MDINILKVLSCNGMHTHIKLGSIKYHIFRYKEWYKMGEKGFIIQTNQTCTFTFMYTHPHMWTYDGQLLKEKLYLTSLSIVPVNKKKGGRLKW